MTEGSAKPRSYALDERKQRALAEQYQGTNVIPNPYDAGFYFYFVEALKTLGADKSHSFTTVREQLKVLMDVPETRGADGKTAWERFAYKSGVALPCEGRIALNAETLQHVREYGLKLVQVGQQVLKSKGVVVDILKGQHATPLYRLNTDSAQPVNEFRRSRRRS